MKKLFTVLVVVAVLLVITGTMLNNGRQPEPFPEGSRSAAWLQPGPLQVVSSDIAFVDGSRPTNPNGDFAGAPARTLQGKLWHPVASEAGPFPLVVYSHGFTSTWEGGAYLGQHLASLGYVVVAVNYPLTNFNAPGGPNVMDVVNQPADITFMIDSLLADSATAGHVLEGMVDGTRIGVTGISLGGMTSTLVAFHPDMRDPRITASLSIAGPTSFLTERFFSFADVPFLMLAGDIDALVPYATNAAPVPEKVPGAELVTIADASHTGFAGPAASLRWMDNPDAIGCYMVSDNVNEAIEQEPWYDLIGSVEQGIDHEAMNELCLMDPLPPAMNVLRQHMITTVVVSSFFESLFAADPEQRRDARVYLSRTLPNELPEVSYRAARG